MLTIEFIATSTISESERESKWSGEDFNTYEVRYNPYRGLVRATMCANFSGILLEAICGLPEHNREKRPITVSTIGDFPQRYLDEIKTVFDLYARAEGVKVEHQTRWFLKFR